MAHRRKKNVLLKPANLAAIAGLITAVTALLTFILPQIFPPPPLPPKTAMVNGTLLFEKNEPAKNTKVVLDSETKEITDEIGQFIFDNVKTGISHYFEVYEGNAMIYHKKFPVPEEASRLVSLGAFMIGVTGSQGDKPPSVSSTTKVLPVVANTSANKAQFANVSKQSTYQISLVEKGETIPKDQSQPGSNPYNFTFSIAAPPQTMSQIKFVTYYLHPTFNPSVVTKTSAENSFALSFTGWGKFDLRAKVYFKDGQIKDLVFPATKWALNQQPQTPPILIVHYEFVRKWGSSGSTNGQFRSPLGIAVDRASNVYVADTGNNRVQKFDNNGTFITSWGSNRTEDAQFRTPKGIAVDSLGNVYVADSGNNRVQKFDTTNVTFITKWNTSGTLQEFIDPESIAVDLSGNNVYVADSGNNVIKAFELLSVCPPVTEIVTGVCSNPSLAFNADLSSPRGIAVDSFHNVYVADTGNNGILKFDNNGTLISRWSSPGRDEGQFITPLDVAVDQSGNVYVADTGNNGILKFDNNGTLISRWGSAGSTNGQFLIPAGIAVDLSGNVYVADTGNNRIQVFAPSTNMSSR